MSTEPDSESIPEIPEPEFNPTLEELEIIEHNFRIQQDVLYAIVGGAAAALISALLWAYITVATEHQVGYMAIAVGAFVGLTVRYLGAGIDTTFGIIGAFFALTWQIFWARLLSLPTKRVARISRPWDSYASPTS